MNAITLTARYALAIVALLFWFAVVQVAIRCDQGVQADWDAGLPFDHFDPALSRVEALHTALFGEEE